MLLDTKAVARYLQISQDTVRKLAQSGVLHTNSAEYLFDYETIKSVLPLLSRFPKKERTLGRIMEYINTEQGENYER